MEMLLRRIILTALLLTFPFAAYAYRVPDREYWHKYIVTLINQSREEHDLPAVGLDEEITEMSQVHAQDSAVSFDDTSDSSRRSSYIAHDSSDGRAFPDRVRERNFSGLLAAGENVGFRYRGPIEELQQMIKESIDLIHSGMMAEVPPDDGHRLTILGDYTHVGVGFEFHRGPGSLVNTLFFVTDFGKFGQERAQDIPELGSAPAPIYTADLRGGQEEESSQKSGMTRRKRTPPEVNPASRRAVAAPSSLWAENSRERVASRKSARLARLLQRVDERKQARLRRREL